MRRRETGWLFLIGLFVSMSLLVVAGCERAPTPTPTPPKGITLKVSEPEDGAVVTSSPVRVSGVTALDAVVSVNGAVVSVEDGGAFSADVDLLEGPNLVEITASDLEGNTATRAIAVIYLP